MHAITKIPFLSILIRPTETLQQIFKRNINYVLVLFILGSLAQTTQRFWNVGSKTHFLSSLLTSMLIAVVIGWIGFYFFSVIVYYCGKIFGGKSDLNHCITIVAWSLVPAIIGSAIYLIAYILYGDAFFRKDVPADSIGNIKTFFFYIRTGLGLWAFYILFKGIMLVQQFTITKTLYTIIAILLITVLLSLIPILIFTI